MRKPLKFKERGTVIEARQVDKDTVVVTQHGDVIAHPSDWIVNNQGVMSVVDNSSFHDKYTPYSTKSFRRSLTADQQRVRDQYIWENRSKMSTRELAQDPRVNLTQPRVVQIIAQMNSRLKVDSQPIDTFDK